VFIHRYTLIFEFESVLNIAIIPPKKRNTNFSRCTSNTERRRKIGDCKIARNRMSILIAVGTDEKRARRLECFRNTASTSRALETV